MLLAGAWIGSRPRITTFGLGVLRQLGCLEDLVGRWVLSEARTFFLEEPLEIAQYCFPNYGSRQCSTLVPNSRFRLVTVMILSPAMP